MEVKVQPVAPSDVETNENPIAVGEDKFIFIMGGPGAGKSTLCRAVAAIEPNFIHISVGSLIRACKSRAGANEPETGSFKDLENRTRDYMLAAQLLPADLVLAIIKQGIDEIRSSSLGKKVFLIDGYPRDAEQAISMIHHELNFGDNMTLIQFVCDSEEMLKRVLERPAEGRIDYNRITFNEMVNQYLSEIPEIVRFLHRKMPFQSMLHFRSGGSLDELVPRFKTLIQKSCEQKISESDRQQYRRRPLKKQRIGLPAGFE
ncbi:hypothetical protein Dda_9033 [Drechslerella dactyloides]|uniref:Adenylate kinase n=1 Tax=Drechslerella dactyloides TaxID=74499 RepID=A0AAD6IPZ7_DREDA|nr:hypothetical protein Dda_9033 [Drechslerella dactyloides]